MYAWTASLILLHVRKNPVASNYNFATKKNVFFTGKDTALPFILTQQVRPEESSTPDFLADRQESLVGVLGKQCNLTKSNTTAA